MENVVNRIIEIDNQASERLENARVKKEQIIQEAYEDAKKIKERILKETEKKIKIKETETKQKLEQEIAEIIENKNKEILAMNEEYKKQHSELEERIFKSIAGE